MPALTIKKVAEPKNVQGTPYTSGGSMADGTYYYVITPVSSQGEDVRGVESSGITITGGGGAGKIVLTWDAIPGVSSYKVYRTTTQGQYASPCYIANPSSNSCTDTAASPSAGAPPKFESDNMKTPQIEETSVLPESFISGRHGGITQFLGSLSDSLRLEGVLITSSAKSDLNKLKILRRHGIAVQIKIVAHSQTWIEDYYTIEKLEWAPRAGRPTASGGEQETGTCNSSNTWLHRNLRTEQ